MTAVEHGDGEKPVPAGADSDSAPERLDSPRIHPAVEAVAGQKRWFGWVFGLIWLTYLYFPLIQVWNSPAGPWRYVGLAALLAFAPGFLIVFSFNRNWRLGPQPSLTRRWLTLGVLTACGALTIPAAHLGGLFVFIFLGVAALFTLPPWHAWGYVISVAVAVTTLALVAGWSDGLGYFLLQFAVSSFAAWGVSQVIKQTVRLRVANARIEQLTIAEERARMARDLHDVLGHSLTVISVKAELAHRLTTVDAERAGTEIGEVQRLARGALADVRATVAGYRGVSLGSQLAVARSALESAGVDANLPTTVDDVPENLRELYGWVLREGVTNVIRHSGASTCRVRFDGGSIEVADNGAGPGLDATDWLDGQAGTTAGHGLGGLAERADAAGARLSVGWAPEGGFLLRVEVR